MTTPVQAQSLTDPKPPLLANWRDFFPLPQIRQKQEKALDFIYRMIERGIKDILIAAPTGAGKSLIGATTAFWAAQQPFPLQGTPGAYYLASQKLLQDQLEDDIHRYPLLLQQAASLKTASEYECSRYGDCGTGLLHKPVCHAVKTKTCAYRCQVARFLKAQLSITNYPYFFTEHIYAGNFPSRRVLIMDEAHALESQLLRFVELVIGPKEIATFLPTVKEVPPLATIQDYCLWLYDIFLPGLRVYREAFEKDPNLTPKRAKQLLEIDNMLSKIDRALNSIADDPDNWIYWQEEEIEKLPGMVERTAIAKPLSAAPYFKDFLQDTADVRIYMSAYLGTKETFCHNLGLDPAATAMLSLGSTFPKENRPIHTTFVGSMGRKSIQTTLPRLYRMLSEIMKNHKDEKGLIHGNSYALCQSIFDHFSTLPQGKRILFPRNVDEREDAYKKHRESNQPTVILSPSFTEGFDFIDDAARWQVIAKCPFPSLGDKQVAAKKDKDPEWYAQKAVTTLIQASGRIVRCFSLDTEILTVEGWKTAETLKAGDIAYGLAPAAFTGERPMRDGCPSLILNQVNSVFRYPQQQTLNITDKTLDILVTPNHRMIVQKVRVNTYARKCTKDYGNGTHVYTYPGSHNVLSHNLSFCPAAELPARYKIPGAGYISGSMGRKRTRLHNNWFWLMGFIIADGCISKNKSTVLIIQSRSPAKAPQVKRLESVLAALNITFNYYEVTEPIACICGKKYTRHGPLGQWVITGADAGRIRDVFVNGRRRRYSRTKKFRRKQHKGTYEYAYVEGWKDCEKTIPRWALQKASASQLHALLDGLMDGDGTWQSENSGTYYTSNPALADAVQELCALIGYASVIRPRKNRNGAIDIFLSKPSTHDISTKAKLGPVCDVWCPNTELGNVVARRKGCTFVCGNSETDHGTTYICDSDFNILWDRWNWMFPSWWKEAVIWI